MFYMCFPIYLPRHLNQFLPNFHHRPGVELAVAEEVLAGAGGFAARHGPDFREDVHGLAAVVNVLQVTVIQFGVVGEEGGQHALDAE